MKVFIVGITGRTGSRIAKLLVEQAALVSGLYRQIDETESIRKMGAEGVLNTRSVSAG